MIAVDPADLLTLVFTSCIDPMLLLDREGRVSALNPAAERLTGRGEGGAIGQTIDALLRPETPVAPLIERVIQARTASTDLVLDLEAGRILEGSVSPLGDTDLALVVLRDVTEHRRAERAAREGEARLRDAVEKLDAGFALYDADERLSFANDRYWAIYPGVSREWAMGKTFEEILRGFCRSGGHLHTGGTEDEWVEKYLAIHRRGHNDYVQRLADRWIRFYDARTSDGGLVKLRTDVSALKETELALEKERQFSKLVLDTVPNQIYVKDEEGRYLLINKKMADRLRTTAEAAQGQTVNTVAPGLDDHRKVDADDQEVIRTRRPVQREASYTSPDGKVHTGVITKVPLIEPDGVVHILGIAVDITERREHEQAMAATIAELERQRQAISDQLSVITEQQRLIEALSTPILDVAEGVIAMPVIGAMDDARAAEITGKVLAAISDKRARYAIIDVTGMGAVDAGVAARLMRLSSAIRLLGAQGIITGIQPAMAAVLADLGVELASISTCATLRDGLDLALRGPGGRSSPRPDPHPSS